MNVWDLVEKISGPLAGAITGLAGSLLGLKKRMGKVEKRVDRQGAALQGHATLIADLDKDIAKLREELEAYQEKQSDFANTIRDSNMDFAKEAELGNFMSEQQERWQTIQRTLGHIEGYLGLNPTSPSIPRPQLRPSNQRTPPPIPTNRRKP
jgi:uncharacterized coiled-coil protein SlyX